MRGRPQVIGVVMAVDAVQHFNAHAQKSCRFPFVDPARINQVAAVCRLCSRLHSRHYLASMGRWLRIGRGGGAYGVGILAYITGTVDQQLLLRNEYLVAENRILFPRVTEMRGSQPVRCRASAPHSTISISSRKGRNARRGRLWHNPAYPQEPSRQRASGLWYS